MSETETAYDSRKDTIDHIQQVRHFMYDALQNLSDRAHVHDASKLLDPEKALFDEFTPKLKATTYGSDEYKQFLADMKRGLDHHYHENSHHPEHYAFVGHSLVPDDVASGAAIARMSLLDILEMLCDWKAATMRHADGDLLKSIELNQKRFGYSDELKSILLNTVREMKL